VRSRELEALHANVAVDLLHYFLRRVEHAEDAADLVGETFLVAWRRISRLPEEPEDQRRWMFGIARLTLANFRRGRRRRTELADALRRTLSEVAPVEIDGSIADALAALPTDQAELVRLVHWDGFSIIDAAHVLRIRESTARGRYQRARLSLRESLKGYS
jgi:RNA polymerase sigma-70 factor (ECF subfamily)